MMIENVAYSAILTNENELIVESFSDKESSTLDLHMMLFSSIDQFFVFSIFGF